MAHQTIVCENGETIAYLRRGGKLPQILWLGGFKSDMGGTKARALDDWAATRGQAYLRFDYFGHGASSGAFADGTISRWLADALAVLDRLCEGPQVLVGSSMGAWIALLAAKARPQKVGGLLLIAPAVDFTEALIWARMNDEIRHDVMHNGFWVRPSRYGESPYPITRGLIEDGRKHLLLDGPIEIKVPVHIVQGMQDPDVPWEHATTLMERLSGNPVLTLIREGDHRLSSPAELARVEQALDRLLTEVGG